VPPPSADGAARSIMIGDRVSEKRKAFMFDHVFGQENAQEDVYTVACLPLVEGLFEGFNASIMAYGQTGSGKTFTMGTAVDAMETDDEGIIPRVVRRIYDTIREKRAQNKIVNVRVSFLEILNEDCKDLLHPEVQSKDIQIREDSDGHIFFTGAREEVATSMDVVMSLLERGCLARTTAGTNMNAQSSRSHAIFTVGVEMYDVSGGQGNLDGSFTASCLQAKLQLVDLAGSERAKKTGALGERLKQSVSINQGLLTLGKVIRALTVSDRQSRSASKKGGGGGGSSQHVPYRESKLTRLLQDSLGGNSRTVFIACVSSSVLNLHETLTTLQYASRAKAIRNKVVANVSVAPVTQAESADETVMEGLRAKLREMESQMASYRQRGGGSLRNSGSGSMRRSGNWPSFDPSAMAGMEAMDYIQIAGVAKSIRSELRTALQALSSAGPGTILGLTSAATHVQGVADSGEDIERRFGVAKGLVVSCRDAVTALGTLVERAMAAATRQDSGGPSSPKAGGPVVPAEEVARLQEELAECREDLARDEEIFAEKVRELKRVRKESRQLAGRNGDLEGQVHELQTDLAAVRAATHIQLASASRIEASSSSIMCSDLDLDESIALVASTEPDISQLMDDLEHVSREKERLLAEKTKAEEESARMASLAEKQREDADATAIEVSRRLRELEIGMRMKQNVITTVATNANEERSKRTAAEVALGRERKAREDAENAFEEATVRSERTERSRVTSHTSAHTSAVASDTQRLQLEVELQSMRKEHSKLTAALDSNQQRQQRQVEVLTSQVARQRKASSESQSQIRALEDRNKDLQARLQRLPGARGGRGLRAETVIPDDSSVQSAATLTIDREGLMKRVSRVAHNQLLETDMHGLRSKIEEAEGETRRLQREHAHILQGSGDGYTRAVEVEEDLETLETELELHRTNLAEMQRNVGHGGGGGSGSRGSSKQRATSDTSDLLLADIQRLQDGQSNILLMGAVRDLVAHKFSAMREDGTLSMVRSQLEEKQAEADDCQRAMYRSKTEAGKRVDSIRQDCDAKVTFLLQQLRETERQLREHQSLTRRSIEIMRSSGENVFSKSGSAGAGVSGGCKDGHAERAYEAERRRREQLEKRNGELVRELRKLRNSTN